MSCHSFETRDICEEVIRRYHGQAIGDECFLMQVRYADTPSQKELKRVTAERRQYRTNEYNIGAYGTMAVGIAPSIYSSQPHSWGRTPRFTRLVTAKKSLSTCHPAVLTYVQRRSWSSPPSCSLCQERKREHDEGPHSPVGSLISARPQP